MKKVHSQLLAAVREEVVLIRRGFEHDDPVRAIEGFAALIITCETVLEATPRLDRDAIMEEVRRARDAGVAPEPAVLLNYIEVEGVEI